MIILCAIRLKRTTPTPLLPCTKGYVSYIIRVDLCGALIYMYMYKRNITHFWLSSSHWYDNSNGWTHHDNSPGNQHHWALNNYTASSHTDVWVESDKDYGWRGHRLSIQSDSVWEALGPSSRTEFQSVVTVSPVWHPRSQLSVESSGLSRLRLNIPIHIHLQ